MEISVKRGSPTTVVDEALVVFIYDDKSITEELEKIDIRLNNIIKSFLKNDHVKGKASELHEVYLDSHVKRLVIVGLGKSSELNLETVRRATATAARYLRDKEIQTFTIDVSNIPRDESKVGQAIAEALVLGLYTFEKYKSKDIKKKVKKAEILVGKNEKAYELGAEAGRIIAGFTNKARDMTNEPGDVLTPREFANKAKELCKETGVKITVFDKKRIKKEAMGGLLGVNMGSSNEPVFMVMEYRNGSGRPIVLVGKGITFDSGGLQIKPGDYMKDMQGDKAGGAAVICAINAVAALKLKLNVVALVPATDNMLNGASYKPGDVLRAANGKTMEIGHTDAEGRLILADALSYAASFKPREVIDLATLTGACMVALGTEAAGLWSTNDEMAEALIKAGDETGDRVWRMPLYDDYAEYIKSEIADVKNIGHPKGYAGACTAAMFLKNFVPDKTNWAHLDIAGSALIDSKKPYAIPLGSGSGVRVLVEYLRNKSL